MKPVVSLPKLVVIGAGGHAKVAIEAIRAQGRYEPVACVDRTERGAVLGVPIVGDDGKLAQLRSEGIAAAFIAIGLNRVRQRLGSDAASKGFDLPTIIDPSARISPTCAIGAGTLVMPLAVINAQADISRLAILNTSCVVEHDCRVGEAAHVAPRSAMAGNVRIGERTFLGVGTVVRPEINIGADVMTGAGSVVVSDIPDGETYVGVPARRLFKSDS